MHSVATAITEKTAVGAFTVVFPFIIAIRFKPFVPYLHEVVVVDVSLGVVASYAETSSYVTIATDAAYSDSCLTRKEVVSHFAFVVAQEAFTSVAYINKFFFA